MIVSGILFLGAAGLAYRTHQISQKEKEIRCAFDFAIKKFNVEESAALGIGAASMSLLDIYVQCENHHQVLETLEYRFNKMMGDASPFEWYSKIEELTQHGDSSINAYISEEIA